jgi:hypothetical protein
MKNGDPRRTAVVVAAVLVLVAGWCIYRDWLPAACVLGAGAGVLLLIGLFVPAGARAFHTGWMAVARALGYVNSRILLGALFFGVFTPYGLVSRLVGRDPLNRRKKPESSYWIPRSKTRQAREQFERLF